MARNIRKIALIGRATDLRVADAMSALGAHLAGAGYAVLVAADGAPNFQGINITRASETQIASESDLIIAIGGDGTLLYAARLLAGRDVPLFGVNRGRLGFLTDVTPAQMLECVDQVLAGDCIEDHRTMLGATLTSRAGKAQSMQALNDVVLQKWETGRILDFETTIDGRYVNTHGGDGLVVATATGSTAYALSCGGPIVEPNLDVVVLVPICPHTLSDRPIVVSTRARIEVRLLERPDTKAQITCDGAMLGDLEPGDVLSIGPTAARVTLLHPPGYEYFRLLRSKLHWGRGAFQQPAGSHED
ncbi:MAG TPA: NAD(+)/NADH kinase [Steroidobacteraceae bacterium]|nr:NAD(+)/NADH kinase [Steroidobacteraceae bacterium]